MNDDLDDRTVVEYFVSHLCKINCQNIKIDSIPDEQNRTSSDIDAVAGNYAIEHTSIDTIPNQRKDSNHFLQAVNLLEDGLKSIIDFRIDITIPYSGIKVGQNWNVINASLKLWILESARTLPEGRQNIHDINGIPFNFYIDKSFTRSPGVFFLRFSPIDDTLLSRIYTQLTRKAKKLQPYKDQGYITILLIESKDPALMNKGIMLESIKDAFKNRLPENVDLIWYAETYDQIEVTFSDFTKHIVRTENL